jgi:transforming growth factor-beta-induced protein
VKAADVVKLEKAKTAQGSDVTIKVEDGKVRVNGALVTKTDIAASNGTIHVIDTVILPPAVAEAAAKANIVQTAVAAGQFKTLATALTAAGLVETLAGEGPFTVFAPTDDAFAKLPAGTLEALLADKEALKKVLLHHVVPGTVKAADVVKLTSAKTAAGTDLAVKVDEGKVHIGAATVVKADVEAANGVIHVIDTVLVP